MNAPIQDNRVLLGSQPQHRQGGNDTFDQVISRHRDIYQWAAQNQFTMERRCLVHMVLRTLRAIEGLEFFEKNRNNWDGQQPDWVPASERRIRQAVVGALEQGMMKRVDAKADSDSSLSVTSTTASESSLESS